MRVLCNWFEERLEIQAVSDDFTSKFVPLHVNIFYCFGGLVFTTFLFQFGTGAFLTLFFRPTVVDSTSFGGAMATQFDFGWFLRGFHRISSNFVLFFMVIHISRVFFTGGHLRPREFTWVSGLLLTLLTSAFGVSGYTIPWDQVGFWAFQIVSAIPASLDLSFPGFGTFVASVFRGGPILGQFSLSRCYFGHTFLLPVLLFSVLIMHFICIRKQGISGPL